MKEIDSAAERRSKIVKLMKRAACAGWDDKGGCTWNSNCDFCIGAKEEDYENAAHLLVSDGYIRAEDLLAELKDRLCQLAKTKSDEKVVSITEIDSVIDNLLKNL